jgi:membrane AbrB-like protein
MTNTSGVARQRPWGAWGLTLALGAGGGAVFWVLGLPLPWMLGAITATTVVAVAGGRLAVADPLRTGMISVLGVMLGSAFHPGMLEQMARWGPSLCGLLAYVGLSTLLVAAWLRRVAGYDPVTAWFSAAPGGLSQMILMGGALGGDERVIGLSHGIRILLVVFTVPTAFALLAGYERPDGGAAVGVGVGPGSGGFDLMDAVWLLGCAVLGGLGARVLKVPAGMMIGPMALSALVHGLGWTASHPPALAVAAAQVVVGASIGARFAGVSAREVARLFVASIGATAVLLALTVAFAGGLSLITPLPPRELILAYAPGGVVEMSLVSLALGVDVAFVSTHHIARILLIVLLAPLAVRLSGRRPDPRG